MDRYSRTHLSDVIVLSDCKSHHAREHAATADALADLAEVDARQLYVGEGYDSTVSYCLGELGLEEPAALKRIRVARAARRFPAIFPMLADGRLHLTAVVMLAAHLTPENADELLAAAAHQTCAGIERLLSRCFARPDLPTRVEQRGELSLRTLETTSQPVPEVSARTPAPEERPRARPLSPGRLGVQFTVSEGTSAKLREVQELLGHDNLSADLPGLFDWGLDLIRERLRRRKFAATDRPRPRLQHHSRNPRHVPAGVKRAVWTRDGGQCTFTSESGHRCEARTHVEFDHIEPIARGGRSTVENLRLRCRAHNQYAADRAFGAGYMARKREIARSGVPTRAAGESAAERQAPAPSATREQEQRQAAAAATEVVPYLRQLGLRPEQARRAAAACEAMPDAPLEQRVREALRCHGRWLAGRGAPAAA